MKKGTKRPETGIINAGAHQASRPMAAFAALAFVVGFSPTPLATRAVGRKPTGATVVPLIMGATPERWKREPKQITPDIDVQQAA